jgi:hypothetical protein
MFACVPDRLAEELVRPTTLNALHTLKELILDDAHRSRARWVLDF